MVKASESTAEEEKKKASEKPLKRSVGDIGSDQKEGVRQNMNDCCKFCNNRLVMEAVKNKDITRVKTLLADIENITNPF